MFCKAGILLMIAQLVLHTDANFQATERHILDLIKDCKKLESVNKGLTCPKQKGIGGQTQSVVTYVRWGVKTYSGEDTETVYSGQGGGGYYSNKGSGVNNLCLPNDPDNGKPLGAGGNGAVSYLYGAEYRIYKENKPSEIKTILKENDVPCAVCLAKRKSTVLMIPGRKTCYQGWRKEYHGYLMAAATGHVSPSDYACVDSAVETIPGGSAN